MNAVDAANASRYSRHTRVLVLAFVLPILACVLIIGGAVLGIPTASEPVNGLSAQTTATQSASVERDLGENSGRPVISLDDAGAGLPV